MGLTILYGSSLSDRTEQLYDRLIRDAVAHPDRRFIMLVPEQASLSVQRALIRRHPRHALLNMDVLTFNRLAFRVFEEIGEPPKGILDDRGREMLLRLVAEREKDRLPVLGRNIRKAGLIHEVKSAVSEFSEYHVTPGILEEQAGALGDYPALQGKLRDIAVLYRAFLALLHEHYEMAEERLGRLAKCISRWPDASRVTVALDGFTGFTPPQYEVIDALLCHTENVWLGACLGTGSAPEGNRSPESLFYMGVHMAEQAGRIAAARSVPCRTYFTGQEAGRGFAPEIRHLEQALFRYPRRPYPGVSEHVRLLRAPDCRTELRAVVSGIRSCIREGFRYRDIGVILGSPEAYREEAEELLSSAGIPYFFDASRAVSMNPLCLCLKNLLNIRDSGFSSDSVFGFLKNPLMQAYAARVLPESGDGYTPFERIAEAENFVLATGIRGEKMYREEWTGMYRGFDTGRLGVINETKDLLLEPVFSWIGRIAGKRPDAAEGGAGTAVSSPDAAEGGAGTAVYSPDAPDSGTGTAGSVPVQEGDPGRAPGLSAPSQAEGGTLTVSDRIDALEAFLEAIRARDTLLAAAEELEAAGRYADAREYRQLPDGILGLFDEIRGILGDRALGDEEFREVLQTGIDRTGVGIAPPTMDCVTVGDLLRTRLDDVKVLFVAGANEGALPAYGNAAGLITDRDREILSEHGVTLSPTAKQEGFFARYYIYMLFTKPSERLVLSWSLTGRDGKPQDPAYPAAELAALFPDAVPETVDESRLMAETAGEAWEQAASGLRAYKDLVFGHTPQKAERMLAESAGGPLEAACSWAHGTPGNEARFRFVRDLLDYRLASEKLDPVLAGRLYGPVLGGSVTRFQYFAACAYRHFAQFGLALEERAVHRVGGEDLGTLYHESLHCFFEKADARGLEWHRLEEADRKALVEESVLEAAQKFGNRLFSDSARNRALITRAVRITDRTVRTLARQWEEGDYDTVRTEVPFRFLRELRDSGQMTALRLKGRIDRVDTALSEDGRRVYVKVIDYKTGYEKLDYTDIYYGTKLQLPLYLDSVLQMEQTARPDAEIIPAGIYYYRIADPVVEDEEGQDPEEQIYKALRMNGLTENMCGSPERIDRDIAETRESSVVEALKLNKDGGFDKRSKTASPEELEKLRRFAVRKAERIAKEIAEGEISVNPFGDRGRPEPCGYCPYRTLCHIGDGIPGITLRKKTEKDLADLTGEADG